VPFQVQALFQKFPIAPQSHHVILHGGCLAKKCSNTVNSDRAKRKHENTIQSWDTLMVEGIPSSAMQFKLSTT